MELIVAKDLHNYLAARLFSSQSTIFVETRTGVPDCVHHSCFVDRVDPMAGLFQIATIKIAYHGPERSAAMIMSC